MYTVCGGADCTSTSFEDFKRRRRPQGVSGDSWLDSPPDTWVAVSRVLTAVATPATSS
jgi:hypothetical protein